MSRFSRARGGGRSAAPTPGVARWPLWSTYAHLVVGDARMLPLARSLAESVLGRVDQTCSRFRPDSDLTLANQHAGSWVEVDPLLVTAVRSAIWAAEVTDGLVDPCLGRPLLALGYDDDLAVVRHRTGGDTVPPGTAPLPVRPGAWRELEVEDEAVRVPEGVALDLGASAKAWAADLVARAVADTAECAVVVSLGGDVRSAGPSGTPPPVWTVRVGEAAEDLEALAAGPAVTVSGGLATSTTVLRGWRSGGSPQHHLLDPATGRPAAAPYRTVTAAGSTCLAANAASTAALVLGTRAPAWLAENDVAGRLVAQDGTVTTVGGWSAGADVPPA